MAEVSQKTISQIENGKRSKSYDRTLASLDIALGSGEQLVKTAQLEARARGEQPPPGELRQYLHDNREIQESLRATVEELRSQLVHGDLPTRWAPPAWADEVLLLAGRLDDDDRASWIALGHRLAGDSSSD